MGEDSIRRRSRAFEFHLTEDYLQIEDYNNVTTRNIWDGLKQSTTAHGIPHINNAKGTIKKGFWSLASLCILGFMVFHLQMLLTNYFRYKINVYTEIVQSYGMVFPVVTVCNMNPVKYSELYRSSTLTSLLKTDSKKKRRKKRSTDALILYDNIDMTGTSVTVTSSGDFPSGWDNKPSALTVEGPSYWRVFRNSREDTSFEWYAYCPGNYFGGTDFVDNTLESQTKMTGPLCSAIPTYTHTSYVTDTTSACWRVTYTCDPGYYFTDSSGSNDHECIGGRELTTGVWNGIIPSCIETNECSSNPCQNGGMCTDQVNSYTCACVAGFTGANCQTNINECSSNPCQSGGTCTDQVNSFLCSCQPGYTGATCQTDINECSSSPCQNGATCTDQVNSFLCTCQPGYTGTACQTDTNECSSSPCQNGGTCSDQVNGFVCACQSGYTGAACETEINECASNPCQNDGTCTEIVNGYSCVCSSGFTGDHCQTDVDECSSNPCQNGGTCSDQVNGFMCACQPGYTGATCETEIIECASNPCQNDGTCTEIINGYTCICNSGFTGVHCQTDIDECFSSPCQNGGTCSDQVNGFLCTCQSGYTGAACQTDINECSSSPCQNGGTCADQVNGFVCACQSGYTGAACETDINECSCNPCQNGGTCNDQINGYSCACVAGYTDVNCQTDVNECTSSPCNNGGTCTDLVNGFTCGCVSGFTGIICQTDVNECTSSPCNNGGTCTDLVNSYTCGCVSGFTGISCQTDVNECTSSPCNNGGTCTDLVNSYTCGCVSGFTGISCQTDVNECSSNPCLNGGTCNDQINSYTCVCTAGYTGPNCATVLSSSNKRDDFLLQEALIETLASLPEETRVQLGYQSDEMILDCGYEGYDCNRTRDFHRYSHPVFGNCYMFNSGWDKNVELFYSHRTGQRYGMSFVAYINQSEYTDTLVGPAGIRVVVHPQFAMPFPEDNGILAKPGELTSIEIRRVDSIRQGSPHGNCTMDIENPDNDVFAQLYGREYSNMGCLKTCYQKQVIEKCGCGDPSLPLIGSALGGTTTACAMSNSKQEQCRYGMETLFIRGQLACVCPQRCSDTSFITDTTTAQWPADKHMDIEIAYLNEKNLIHQIDNISDAYKNLLKVEIYFKEFNLERIMEKPAYLSSQVLSDLGGACGLWFGMSILSFVEFLEFFVDICVLACVKLKTRCSGDNLNKNVVTVQQRPPYRHHLDQTKYSLNSTGKRKQSLTALKFIAENKARQKRKNRSRSPTTVSTDHSGVVIKGDHVYVDERRYINLINNNPNNTDSNADDYPNPIDWIRMV